MLSAWLTSSSYKRRATAAPDVDGGSERRSKRQRVARSPGSGAGAGAGAGTRLSSVAGVRAKVSIPGAGGYDKLQVVRFATGGTSGPNIKPSDRDHLVTVKTSHAGVNYADVCVRWFDCKPDSILGLYASAKKFVGWPITPGFEFVGAVESVGKAVTDLKVGDKVFGATMFGGYSTHVTVHRRQVFPLPDTLAPKVAAGLPAVAMTAYYAMFEQARLRPGHNVLVHSAAGGVGTMLCQMGKIAGCTVVGVVGASHKVAHALAHGCDYVVDKSKSDLWQSVEKLCPEGFHAVFDANGVSTLQQSFAHLAQTGRLIVYGFHSMLPRRGGVLGAKQWLKLAWDFCRTPRFMPLDMTATNRSVLAFNLSFLFGEHELLRRCMTDIIRWIAEGKLRAPPARVFPMRDVAKAHAAIESGKTVGKLVLDTTAV